MVLNKILPIGAIAAGVALVMASSGFTKASKANLSYFYEFTGTTSQLADANYYHRETPTCDDQTGVICGINLPSDAPQNSTPDPTELSQYANELQQSASSGQSTLPGVIEMKP